MNISNIDVSSYPNSEKIYIDGTLFPIKVAMRKIHQYPTVKMEDGKRVEYPNAPVVVYDTSGVYTDPSFTPDVNKGIPRLKEQWVIEREDTIELDDITSEYGKMRRDDKSLDPIRFPIHHKPRKAAEGKRVTQIHYYR